MPNDNKVFWRPHPPSRPTATAPTTTTSSSSSTTTTTAATTTTNTTRGVGDL